MSAAGGCLLGGVSAAGGCLLWGSVCSQGGSAARGVSAAGWGVCSGGSALGGCLLLVGGCLLQEGVGGVVSQHALRQTPPPPVDRQTPVKT